MLVDLLLSCKKDPRKSLSVKDHAQVRNKPKTKVSTFANFVVGHLIKEKEQQK